MTALLIGLDRPSRSGTRADVLILASFDRKKREVRLLSIPRDTLISLPKLGRMKICEAFMKGRLPLTLQAVKALTGRKPQKFLILDFKGFQRIVDLLGGVKVHVRRRMFYVDKSQNLKIDLKPGWQTLSGREALAYVRFRVGDPEGDIGRIRRQFEVINALLKKALSLVNLPRLPKLLYLALRSTKTNLSPFEVASILWWMKRGSVRMRHRILPGRMRMLSGRGYWVPDGKSSPKAIGWLFGG